MKNPWAMKMEQFTRFSTEERERLDGLITARQRKYKPHEDIVADGEHSSYCYVLLEGWPAATKSCPMASDKLWPFLYPAISVTLKFSS